jgi:hypothetical protein
MEPQIVKVQVPLVSTRPRAGSVLVYDHRRVHLLEQIVDEKILAFIGDRRKAYFNATWTGAIWEIGEKVGDQPW